MAILLWLGQCKKHKRLTIHTPTFLPFLTFFSFTFWKTVEKINVAVQAIGWEQFKCLIHAISWYPRNITDSWVRQPHFKASWAVFCKRKPSNYPPSW